MNILLIDNRDSFTFNLAEAFRVAGAEVAVVRNSIDPRLALQRARETQAAILLSPGPGRPADAGCCLDLVRLARGRMPVIGITAAVSIPSNCTPHCVSACANEVEEVD